MKEIKKAFLALKTPMEEISIPGWKVQEGKRYGVKRRIFKSPVGPSIALYESDLGCRLMVQDLSSGGGASPESCAFWSNWPTVARIFSAGIDSIRSADELMRRNPVAGHKAMELFHQMVFVRSGQRNFTKETEFRFYERFFSKNWALAPRRKKFSSLSEKETARLLFRGLFNMETLGFDEETREAFILPSLDLSKGYSDFYFYYRGRLPDKSVGSFSRYSYRDNVRKKEVSFDYLSYRNEILEPFIMKDVELDIHEPREWFSRVEKILKSFSLRRPDNIPNKTFKQLQELFDGHIGYFVLDIEKFDVFPVVESVWRYPGERFDIVGVDEDDDYEEVPF